MFKRFFFLYFMLSVSLAAAAVCPLALAEQSQILSGEIHVTSSDNMELKPLFYQFPYSETMRQLPRIAMGVNHYDAQPSSVLGLEVLIHKATEESVNFSIRMNENSGWKEMRMNFLSTTRKDLEFGTVNYMPGPEGQVKDFDLVYGMMNDWEDGRIKVKTFLQIIDLQTSNQHTIGLFIQKTDISKKSITFTYSTNQTTIVHQLMINVVLFNANNPSFRYSEGLISQNYLYSKTKIQIPKQGIEKVRTYIVGVASFEVAVTSYISIFASMNEDFFLEVGPNTADSEINHITISYLVLSIYSACGSCEGYYYNHEGKCVRICPVGYFQKLGECLKIQCAKGYYFSMEEDKCVRCNSDVADRQECKDVCEEGLELDGYECVSICKKTNQVYQSGKCICEDGFVRVRGECTKCLQNEEYDGEKCVCKEDFNRIFGRCQKCPEGRIYEPVSSSCVPHCTQNETLIDGRCFCKEKYYRVNSVCITCSSSNSYFSPIYQKCIPKCTFKEIYSTQSNSCVCLPGFIRKNYECQLCPETNIYNAEKLTCDLLCPENSVAVGEVCVCLEGFYEQEGKCFEKICPQNSVFNERQKECICNDGYVLDIQTGLCNIQKPCPLFSSRVGGECWCYDGYHLSKEGECIKCYDNEYFNGYQCVCKPGMVRDQSGICGTPTVITCPKNQFFNPHKKCCMCKYGYQRVRGVCKKVESCSQNQYWNGISCVCETGYIYSGGKCVRVLKPEPNCPENAYFNGIKCVCQGGFFQMQPGTCKQCPTGTYWNGRQCSKQKGCLQGYTWNNQYNCCVVLIIWCDLSSYFNGFACVCKDGYNVINNQCQKCPEGTNFDGASCVVSSSPAKCYKANEILIDGKCVCEEKFHRYNGECITCPENLNWNGRFCETAKKEVECLGTDLEVRRKGQCECLESYRKINGFCIQKTAVITINYTF